MKQTRSLKATCRWQTVVTSVHLIRLPRAYIQHQDLEKDIVVPEEDYWIGLIREIRADNPDDVSTPRACLRP